VFQDFGARFEGVGINCCGFGRRDIDRELLEIESATAGELNDHFRRWAWNGETKVSSRFVAERIDGQSMRQSCSICQNMR
jgi:hypothetical protein